jgi:hypothetical protein
MIKRVTLCDGSCLRCDYPSWGILWSVNRGHTWELEGPYAHRTEAENRRTELLGGRGPLIVRIINWPGRGPRPRAA